jgi:hypothetical protein
MQKDRALFIAKTIDEAHGNTFVDAQELVIDIYNHVEETTFKNLSEENKMLYANIESKQYEIDNLSEQKSIDEGKKFALGVLTGWCLYYIISNLV